MKIILVMVETLNGKTTKGTTAGTSSWASQEDQDYFFKTLSENNLFIMGRRTYEAAKENMQLSDDRLRIILTSSPEKFVNDEVKGQLEFSSDDPQSLIKNLAERGYTQAILLGGAHTNTDFLKEKLVSEIWLTLEPKIFGTGNNLFSDEQLELDLELLSNEKLNPQGTLLLKYHVL